jgi:putative hydrolases of HD superfamily
LFFFTEEKAILDTQMKNKVEKIFDFLEISEQLKNTKRWKNVPQMKKKETSADHTWHVALLACLFAKELKLEINFLKAIQIIIIHDLAEAITDDIDYVQFFKGLADPKDKDRDERLAIKKIRSVLPEKSGKIIFDLWQEYEDKSTAEGKFAYAMDKIEGLHHMVHTGHECFHFAEIIGTYPNKAVASFPGLKSVLCEHKKRAKREMEKHGWDWKDEYDLDRSDSIKTTEEIEQIFDFIKISENLKDTKRYLNTKEIKHKESSAEHSWHVALMAIITFYEFDFDINLEKAIKIALVHDLPESLAGDTDYSLVAWGIKTKEEKHRLEVEAINKIKEALPQKSGQEVYDLWQEYEEAKTKEARFIKAVDKIEGINHMLVLGYTSFDYPELIAPYPNKAVGNYPELKPMLNELHNRLKPLFKKKGWNWEDNYNLS